MTNRFRNKVQPGWATSLDYDIARSHFAFACVDLVVFVSKGFILVKRKEPPYKGKWHLPGGIIHKGQTIEDKVTEIADRELNCEVKVFKFIGVFQNFHRYRHDISLSYGAKLKSRRGFVETAERKIFHAIPGNTIPYHKLVLSNETRKSSE